jgi:transcriptional regulator with XRE-family HTH domain
MSEARGEDQVQTAVANERDQIVPGNLTEKQQLAIELQVIGTKQKDVAEAVGISRQQIRRWEQDQSFKTALERRRAELHQGIADQYWGGLVPQALNVAAESLAEGDPEMARDILRLAARGLTDLKMRNPEPPSMYDA